MTTRGRKSAASLAIADTVEITPRQAPPAELSEYEAAVWMSLVNSKPAAWFQADTRLLLIAYCKHASESQRLDAMIAAVGVIADDKELQTYQRLLDMREKQTRALTALSRSMRLTQQARYDKRVAAGHAKKSSAKALWDA